MGGQPPRGGRLGRTSTHVLGLLLLGASAHRGTEKGTLDTPSTVAGKTASTFLFSGMRKNTDLSPVINKQAYKGSLSPDIRNVYIN